MPDGTSGLFAVRCLSLARVHGGTANGHVHAVAARDSVTGSASAPYVVAWPTTKVVVAKPTSQQVVPGLASQIIAAAPADQDVWTPPADEVIVPCNTEDPVATWTAAEQLDVRAAVEPVTTRAPARQIVDVCETVEGLVSENRVVARAAEDRRTTLRAVVPSCAAFTDPIVATAAKNAVSAAQQVVPAQPMYLLSTPPREDHVWPSGPNQPRSTSAAHNRRRLAQTLWPGANLGDGGIRGRRCGEQEHNSQRRSDSPGPFL